MILKDIYNYLASDEALSLVLSSTQTDSKIYPNFARISSRLPYIVYRSTNPGGTTDEVLSTEQITLTITADDFLQITQISYLLTELLDLTANEIPSQEYKIYYSKKIGGNDFLDELGRHVRAINFIFKFKKI
jgi:secreted protein with Ig-like and vWFA domain